MKKIFIFIFVFWLFPIVSLAADYDITHYYIDAKVSENGDMQVQELLVLDGTFNGYERDIYYEGNKTSDSLYNASSLEDLQISAKYVSDVSFDTFNENFDSFNLVNYATNGEKAKYILSTLYGGYRIRMYYKTDNRSTAFLIKYTLKDVVINYDDFAELYWNFIGDDFSDPIHDLKIRVTLPGKDESDYYRIWAHGELTGDINFDNTATNSRMLATIPKVTPNTAVDIRTTFNKTLVNNVTKKSNKTFDNIIAEETKKADEANQLRKAIKRKYNFAVIAMILFYAYTILSFIYVYFKYDRERKSSFNLKYNREFIDDYNVEVVDYLMNKNITSKAMSASILNLIYKKNIKVEKVPESKKDYEFTLISRDNLNRTENALVDFLFITVGNDNGFTTKSLKKYASSTKTCEKFMETYTDWKTKVTLDGEAQEFFETNKKYLGFSFVTIFWSILMFIYMIGNDFDDGFLLGLGIISIVVAVIYLIYTLTFSKKTAKGIEHYARWKAFKNFLADFGDFSVKDLPEIILWERYLVYATVFGLADKVSKAMDVKVKEIDPNMLNNSVYSFNDYLFSLHLAHVLDSSIGSAIASSTATIARVNAENANSNFSSGSGFGGGFSSGGGFGGGGGGGRGF